MTDEAQRRCCACLGRPAPRAPARHPPRGEFDRLEIQHFFEVYRTSSPANVEGATWAGHRRRGRDHASVARHLEHEAAIESAIEDAAH
jgi:hypothetical protein